jgi:hypothetical protein
MKRREAIRKGVAAGAALVAGVSVPLGAAQPTTILGRDFAELLAIYDPTIDPNATGPWQFPESKLDDYEPLGIDIDRLSADDWRSDVLATGAVGKDLRRADILVVFNERPVRGVFEASSKDGWVRFLAHRSIVDPNTGKGSPITPYMHPNGKGLVHGIAFGRVEWWVRKGKIVSRP